jgi:flavin reductase (DIM6/NTAB) family NADH-FMN oxidoreductase RutF
VIPAWPEGTVAVLSTGGGEPHAIPVSTAVRVGERTIGFALAHRRESLRRLRAEPRCALTVVAAGVAFTALGRAAVVRELERVAIVQLDVERVQDHMQDTFAIDAGVQWRWTDAGAERADAQLRALLRGDGDVAP